MDRNRVNLKDIIWVIGIREKEDGKKTFLSIPYVIEESIKGYEDLIDLTEIWATAFPGKVTEKDIIKKYEDIHNAKVIKIISSEEALKNYILNHDNQFKTQIEKLIALNLEQAVKNYCAVKVLNKEEGSDLIGEINTGVKTRYKQIKEKAENIKDDTIVNNL